MWSVPGPLSSSSPRRERAARLDIRGRAGPSAPPPQHRPRQPIRNLQPPVPLPRSRASAAPGGRTGRAQKVDVAPEEPARRADCARVGRCSPAVSPPLPETPIFSLGTASRCPVAERLLRRPLGPRSRDLGCPPQNCQPSSRLEILAQPPEEGAGLPGWASKVVWAGAGNGTEPPGGSSTAYGRTNKSRSHPLTSDPGAPSMCPALPLGLGV